MKQTTHEYSIGLDIGTDSVGHAVIGTNYKVLSYNRRKMWGVYLLEPGKTAVDRRSLRTARRRMVRRAERIRLLRELTSNTVLSKDDSFFFRLTKSSYLPLSKDDITGRGNKYNIFNDKDFTDKDYNAKYPTIYHLRYDLMTNKVKADPRLIYLALHHIIKYRGNFLHEGDSKSVGGNLQDMLPEYFKAVDEAFAAVGDDDAEAVQIYDELKIVKIVEILNDKRMFKDDKIKTIKLLYTNKLESGIIEAHAKALLGRKVDISKVYALEGIEIQNEKELKFAFSDAEFDLKEGELITVLGDFGHLFVQLKDIYGALMFGEVTLGKDCISLAMIERYDMHKQHLRWLKNCLKDNKSLKYDMFYKKPNPKDKNGLCNYWAYINTHKACPLKEFVDYVKIILEQVPDCEDKNCILQAIAKEEFMPKQTSVINSYIPHQFNEQELKLILNNQKVYYSELSDNYEKIVSLLTFRRPYYVGVLNCDSQYSWSDNKISERVYPWNFAELVNYEAAQEKFINNLTNYCNFYKEQPVLAKSSITYQTYSTLNELNCIKIKGNAIPHDIKVEIFEKLCKNMNTVSVASIVKHINKAFLRQYKAEDFTGFAGEGKLIASMSTYKAFKRIFADKFNEKDVMVYDKIARDLTIFNEQQSRADILKIKHKLEDNIVNELKRLRLSGWGRYCDKLLNGTYGEAGKSIIDSLYDKEMHFNGIIFDEALGFSAKLKINDEKIEKFSYIDNVEDLYCSPKVKKAIWSTLKIVAELEHIMGCPPKHIFIETTETDDIKKATTTRADKIKVAYAEIKQDCEYMVEELMVERDKAIKNNQLSDKLYLWLLQMGKCMYSEEYMPLDNLNNYEIDHIVPRCYIKDDSIENRVLVKKIENQQKSSTLALSPIIRSKMVGFWNFLLSKKLMTKKKYFNLIKDQYDDNDSAKFIDRQLVETNQIVRAVREILIKKYPQESVQGIRAGLSSTMRSKYMHLGKEGFYKNRALNDLHHAKDAYLAAVLGQFVSDAYPLWGQDKEAREAKRNMFKISQQSEVAKGDIYKLVNKRYGVIIDALESENMDLFEMDDEGEYKWNTTYYNNVLAQMSYNDINVVKQKVFRANKNFYDMQYVKKGANLSPKKFVKSRTGDLVPLNPALYGGYNSTMEEYFCIVKGLQKNGGAINEIVGVPVLDAYRIRAGKMTLKDAVAKKISKKIIDFSIVDKDLYKYQAVKIKCKNGGNHLCMLTSSSEIISATELIVDSKYEKLLYNVAKFCDKDNEKNNYKFKKEVLEILERQPDLAKEFTASYLEKIEKYYPLYIKYIDSIKEVSNNQFDDAKIEDKILYLDFLLKLTQFKSKHCKPPKGLGKDVECGRLQMKINPAEVEFIDQSITGLYVTIIKGKDL